MPSYNPMNLPATGHRSVKYRVIRRPLNDHKAQEEALNKFAGFGYKVVFERVDTNETVKLGGKQVTGVIYFTLERKTRRPAGA